MAEKGGDFPLGERKFRNIEDGVFILVGETKVMEGNGFGNGLHPPFEGRDDIRNTQTAQAEVRRILRALRFEFSRSPFAFDASTLHIDNAVSNIPQVMQAVFHYDNRLAARFPKLDYFGEVRNRFQVKICRRLIEYEYVRIRRIHRSAGNFLLFPARKMENVTAQQRFQMKILY